jgi:hypothetical protein
MDNFIFGGSPPTCSPRGQSNQMGVFELRIGLGPTNNSCCNIKGFIKLNFIKLKAFIKIFFK